jgi:hypothetical protein
MVLVAAMVAALAGAAAAGEIEQARSFVKIGDYANAVLVLHKLTLREPANVTARQLLARAFVESPHELHLADIRVGSSNRDRAVYQLEILAKLGEEGRTGLVACIADGGSKLAPLAVEVAGTRRVGEALDAIVAFGQTEEPPQKGHATPLSATALARIGGQRAVAALRAMLDAGPHERFRAGVIGAYVDAVDADGLLRLARESRAEDVIARVVKDKEQHAAPVYAAILGRDDLSAPLRAAAMGRLAAAKDWAAEKRADVIFAATRGKDAATLRSPAIDALRTLDRDKAAELAVAELEAPNGGKINPKHVELLAAGGGQGVTDLLLRILEEKTNRDTYARWASIDRRVVWKTLGLRGVKGAELVRAAKLMVKPEFRAKGRPTRGEALSTWINYRSGLSKKAQAILVAHLVKDDDPGVRLQALYACRSLPGKVGVRHAQALADDKDEKVRRLAGEMLMNYAGEGLLQGAEIMAIVESTRGYRLSPVLKNLVRQKRKADAPLFLKILERDDRTSHYIARPAADYFRAVPDPRAAEPLMKLLTDKQQLHSGDIPVVAAALRACANDRAELTEKVLAGLKSDESSVRQTSAIALRHLGDKSCLAALGRAAKAEKSHHVRSEIDRTIREILTREGKD